MTASPELIQAGLTLLKAAAEYWYAAHRDGIYGAVIWLDDSVGNTVIFTRGEYRHQLMTNIEPVDAEKFFDHIVTDPDFEADEEES